MISVIRLTLSRSTSPQVLRVAGVALIVLVAVMAAAPVARGRVVQHPLDVAPFLLLVAAVGAFWSLPGDFPRRMKSNPLSIAGFSLIVLFVIVDARAPVPVAFPSLVLAVVITAVLGKGLDKVMLSIAIVGWPVYARLLRGEILSVKQRDYVEAARAAGAGDLRVILQHVIPNTIYPFLVYAAFDTGVIVLVAAALSFLGLGAEVGYADWGQLINMSRSWILGVPGDPFIYWYTVVFPGLVIFLFVLGWNLLGDAFRDILDPRLRGSA